jgi:hypothetical protein
MEIKISGEARRMLEKAMAAAPGAGIQLNGDHTRGNFSGHGIEGHYSACDDALTVTVTDMPFFAPASLVEAKIREFFMQG